MSKTVKLENEVYNRLDAFQGKHETKSQAVSRLLSLLEKVGQLRDILEGQVALKNQQRDQLGEQTSVNR